MDEVSCATGCSCHAHLHSAAQSLEELDFSRGIWSAAVDGEENRVRTHLCHTHPDTRDTAGYTALHYAARNGHLSVCQVLIAAGATVNVTTVAGGATPLHRGCSCGRGKVVTFLLDNGADPHLTDQDGMTSLHKACAAGHCDIVHQLCDRIMDPVQSLNRRDNRGHTPLDLLRVTVREIQVLEIVNRYSKTN